MEYKVKLSQFEGPLDLLLHLIKKAKIDLQDIFVSEITDQYLAYMDQIGQLDMNNASEFLNMAALLLYIKSRSLLPEKREDVADEDDDPEAELIERLKAYQLYKRAAEEMGVMEKDAGGTYYKLPDEIFFGERELVIVDADANALYEAFKALLKNKSKKDVIEHRQVAIKNDSFSIRKQKKMLVDMLKRRKKLSFFDVFDVHATRMELAVTFLALLELWHEKVVKVRQKSFLNDIKLEYTEIQEMRN